VDTVGQGAAVGLQVTVKSSGTAVHAVSKVISTVFVVCGVSGALGACGRRASTAQLSGTEPVIAVHCGVAWQVLARQTTPSPW
jgi:hypothetical protein